MASLTCPACGAPVPMRTAAPFAVCGHCQSLLVRRDLGVDTIGRVAVVPEDFSPFQIGTQGTFDRHRFTLVGRLRKTWEQGGWNEWCALLDDGRFGWLAEAQGDLVMTFATPPKAFGNKPPGHASAMDVGSVLIIEGLRYSIVDVKEVRCTAAEGELESWAGDCSDMTTIDLHGPDFAFATIEFERNGVGLFVGRYVDFDECAFTGLRAVDGWTPTASHPVA